MQSPQTPLSRSQYVPLWDVLTIGLLLVAAWYLYGSAGNHRYSYYESLRNWVTVAWVAAGVRFYMHRWFIVTVLAVLIAILFNPITPVTMRKWQWQPYDHWAMIFSVVAAIVLAVLTYRAGQAAKGASNIM